MKCELCGKEMVGSALLLMEYEAHSRYVFPLNTTSADYVCIKCNLAFYGDEVWFEGTKYTLTEWQRILHLKAFL